MALNFLESDYPVNGIEEILHYVSSGSILDLGCGNGRNSRALVDYSKRFNTVIGVDIDERQSNLFLRAIPTEENREVRGYFSYDLSSGRDLRKLSHSFGTDELLSKGFNVVIMSHILNSMERDEARDLIKLAQSMTVKGGVNFITAFTDLEKRPFNPENETLKRYVPRWTDVSELYDLEQWNMLGKPFNYEMRIREEQDRSFPAFSFLAQKK